MMQHPGRTTMASPPRPILKRKSSWDRTTPLKIRCMEEIEGATTTTTTTHSSSFLSSSSVSFSAAAAATTTTAVVVFSDVAIDMETGEHVLPSARSREDFVRAAEERRSERMLEMFRAREERFAAEVEAAKRRAAEINADLFPNGRNDDGEEESDSGLSDEEEEGEGGEGGEEEEEVVEWFSNVKIEGESHKDLDGNGDGDGGSGGNDADVDADAGDFEIVFEAEETSDEGLDGSADDEWDEDDEEDDEDDSDDDEDMDLEGGCTLTWDFEEEDK